VSPSIFSIQNENLASDLTRVPSPGAGRIGVIQAPDSFSGPNLLGAPDPASTFGEVLQQFLGKVDQAQHHSDDMVESLALGEPVDVHQVMLSLSEASHALNLTLQVRTKLLEAYQEIMRVPL
jgi:flagellar hook-basal body complex protein FliE